jgi:hypothetical protein
MGTMRETIKKILRESDSSISSGLYTGPMELGLKKWDEKELKPYTNFVDSKFNHNKKQKTLKNNIKKVVGVWEKDSNGSFDRRTHDVHTIKEENDFEWTQEYQMDVPLEDIVNWCENNRIQIADWIQKIDEFDKHSPQMKWDGDDSEFADENKMIALSVRGIGDELKNIYASFEAIKGEIDYIQNPEKYND